MDMNDGMFEINGKCGFVLKPEVLREGRDPYVEPAFREVRLRLTINVSF